MTSIKDCVRTHDDVTITASKEKIFTLGEIAKGYSDKSEDNVGGVTTMDGYINIRPKYQRAFIVEKDKKWRSRLIDSVLNGRPIGNFYFAAKDNGYYEVLDGQQRLMTLCAVISNGNEGTISYVDEKDGRTKEGAFNNLPPKWQKKIKDYKLKVYLCYGEEEGMLNWFTTINQPHSELTKQEIRNAVYCGTFVEDAKRLFSKTKANSAPTSEFQDHDSPYYFDKFSHSLKLERQDFLERVIDWVSIPMSEYNPRKKNETGDEKEERINNYMSIHRNDANADSLVIGYKKIVDWAYRTFDEDIIKQKGVRGCDWGELYALFGHKTFDLEKINREMDELLDNNSIARTQNVAKYVLAGKQTNDEDENIRYKLLNVKGLTERERNKLYKMQGGIDPIDGRHYDIKDMQAHHIVPIYAGGETKLGNMVLLSAENHHKYHYKGICTAEQLKEKYEALVQKIGYAK